MQLIEKAFSYKSAAATTSTSMSHHGAQSSSGSPAVPSRRLSGDSASASGSPPVQRSPPNLPVAQHRQPLAVSSASALPGLTHARAASSSSMPAMQFASAVPAVQRPKQGLSAEQIKQSLIRLHLYMDVVTEDAVTKVLEKMQRSDAVCHAVCSSIKTWTLPDSVTALVPVVMRNSVLEFVLGLDLEDGIGS